jgi:hypothetical protein
MTDPDLSAFDPAAALAGVDAQRGAGTERRSSGGSPTPSSGQNASGNRDGGQNRSTPTDSEDRERSEIADVWDADGW